MAIILPEQFKENKYLDLKSVITKDICKIVTKYALLQEVTEFDPELGETAQVANAHSKYADTLMETLLHFLQPIMEKNTGLELCPTYSYYRVYHPGMTLAHHIDRPSCEISTTVCFGINYTDTDPDYRWGMYVDSGILCKQDPGDIIVYRGCDVDHWRDEFKAGPGSYQVQGFFHYINKDGPYYPAYAYDKRPGLGYKDSNRLNN
jgi:hypothetical protein